jgi:NAD(P)-dependent dehydrogenase (short-subunit alcohol dehydrogenase family)
VADVGEYQGKVAIVTGGAGALGRAVAAAFAEAGARVVLSDQDGSRGAAVAESLRARGDVQFIKADPADPSDAERLASEAAALGRIDVLAHHGTTRSRSSALDTPVAGWRSDIDAGLSSAFYLGRAVARRMAGTGGGSVVNVTAVDADEATPGRATAAAVSNALIGLSRALAVEWAKLGVRVNALVPGLVFDENDRVASDRGELSLERVRLRAPDHRFGDPEEIARAILFLSGPRASFVTGQVLFADRGWNALTMHPDGMRFP